MSRVNPLGHEPVASRWLFLLDALSPADVLREPDVAPAPFVCLLAWDASLASVDEAASLARRLLDVGCCYICCWGDRCKWVHDIFDEVSQSNPDAPLLMSTWHPNESLMDAVWFAVRCAYPDEAFAHCSSVVAISIAKRARELKLAMSAYLKHTESPETPN